MWIVTMDHAVMGRAQRDQVLDGIGPSIRAMNHVMLMRPLSFIALAAVLINVSATSFIALCRLLTSRGGPGPFGFFDRVVAAEIVLKHRLNRVLETYKLSLFSAHDVAGALEKFKGFMRQVQGCLLRSDAARFGDFLFEF